MKTLLYVDENVVDDAVFRSGDIVLEIKQLEEWEIGRDGEIISAVEKPLVRTRAFFGAQEGYNVEKPELLYSRTSLASLLGVGENRIKEWSDEGCPSIHLSIDKNGNKSCQRFIWPEVNAWLKARELKASESEKGGEA